MLRPPEVVWVGLPRVLAGLGLSRWEQQFPEDGRVERTKDASVEVDDSPEGRPQLGQLGAQRPEGGGRLWTPFSEAALQRGPEEAPRSLAYECADRVVVLPKLRYLSAQQTPALPRRRRSPPLARGFSQQLQRRLPEPRQRLLQVGFPAAPGTQH